MIWSAEPLDHEDAGLPPGTILAGGEDRLVQTGQGLLRLVTVSEYGKIPEDAVSPGEIFLEDKTTYLRQDRK